MVSHSTEILQFFFLIKFWILILSPRSALFPCLVWGRKIFSTEKKRNYCQGSTDRWHRPLLLSSWFCWPLEIWPAGTTPVCGSLTIAKNMQKLLGKINGPKNIRHTPTIAVIGSGGGFRAMTGTGIHGPAQVGSKLYRTVRGSLKRDGRCNESSSKYWNFRLLYLFCGFIRYWLNGIQNGVKTKPHFTDLLTGLPPCKSWLTTWQIPDLMSH